jgi:hypothetical protein
MVFYRTGRTTALYALRAKREKRLLIIEVLTVGGLKHDIGAMPSFVISTMRLQRPVCSKKTMCWIQHGVPLQNSVSDVAPRI